MRYFLLTFAALTLSACASHANKVDRDPAYAICSADQALNSPIQGKSSLDWVREIYAGYAKVSLSDVEARPFVDVESRSTERDHAADPYRFTATFNRCSNNAVAIHFMVNHICTFRQPLGTPVHVDADHERCD